MHHAPRRPGLDGFQELEGEPPRRTIVIADDNQLVRFGLRSVIESDPRYAVVGEAGDGIRAIEMVRDLRPDMALLDIDMPHMDGFDALPAIRQANPLTRVLMVSIHETEDVVMRVLSAGAHGYLPKGAAGSELMLALEALTRGRFYLSPTIASAVVGRAVAPRTSSPQSGSDPSQRAPPG